MMIPGIELLSAMRSDTGVVRAVNEDTAYAVAPCFLVADGMGGHEAGDVASRAAVAAFTAGEPSERLWTLAEASAALERATTAVAAVAAEHVRGAGCTLAAALLVEHDQSPYWLVLNIGDSRVYLVREAALHQLTVDHSLYAEALAAGVSDPAQLPPRNVITRALGSDETLADSWLLPVEPGVRLLVCSDGLTTELADDEIERILSSGSSCDETVDELVMRANLAGGRDNISVVLIDVCAGVSGAEREAG